MDNLPRFSSTLDTIIALRKSRGLMTSPHDLAVLMEADNFGKVLVFRSTDNQPIGYVSFGWLDPASFDFHPDLESGLITFIFEVLCVKDYSTLAIKQLRQFLRAHRMIAFARRGKLRCKIWRNGFKTVRL